MYPSLPSMKNAAMLTGRPVPSSIISIISWELLASLSLMTTATAPASLAASDLLRNEQSLKRITYTNTVYIAWSHSLKFSYIFKYLFIVFHKQLNQIPLQIMRSQLPQYGSCSISNLHVRYCSLELTANSCLFETYPHRIVVYVQLCLNSELFSRVRRVKLP